MNSSCRRRRLSSVMSWATAIVPAIAPLGGVAHRLARVRPAMLGEGHQLGRVRPVRLAGADQRGHLAQTQAHDAVGRQAQGGQGRAGGEGDPQRGVGRPDHRRCLLEQQAQARLPLLQRLLGVLARGELGLQPLVGGA